MYYGKSPFELRPIELEWRSSANGSAWPVANPVLTCATATDAGYPSNFVADSFLYVQLTEKKLANSMRDIKVQKLVLDISVGKSSSPHLRVQGARRPATHSASRSTAAGDALGEQKHRWRMAVATGTTVAAQPT